MTIPKNSIEPLHTFFTRREEVYDECRNELVQIVNHLLWLIPEELSTFKEEVFYSPELAIRFFEDLFKNSTNWTWNLDKIKNLSEYGFEDNGDAIEKLTLLSEAWKDLIDIEIIPPAEWEDWYITVHYKLIKKDS